MALPDPNKPLIQQSTAQTLTLKDLLFYQQETEKWSQNTDVNTFRAYIEEKEQGEDLIKAITNIQGGNDASIGKLSSAVENSTFDNEKFQTTVAGALGRGFGSFFKPFERLSKTLNDIDFSSFSRASFSATTQLTQGAEKVHAGFKELTNGIGALGPVVNTIRTIMFKTVGAVNMVTGVFQILYGGILKLVRGVAKGVFGFETAGAAEDAREKENQEKKKKLAELEEKIARQESSEGLNQKLIDPVPLPVNVVGGGAGGASEGMLINPNTGRPFPAGGSAQNLEKKRSDALMQMDKERAELLEEIDKADAKRDEELDKKKKKSEGMGFKRFLLIAAILVALIAGIIASITAAVPGSFTGLATGIRNAIVNAKSNMQKVLDNLKAKGREVSSIFKATDEPKTKTPKTEEPKTRTPKTTKIILDPKDVDKPKVDAGKPVKIVDSKGKEIKVDKPPTQTTTAPKSSVMEKSAKIGKNILRAAPPVTAAVETTLDAMSNEDKFQFIKERYESGALFDFGDGDIRPMTDEEFEALKKYRAANFSGSIGRGGGALAGASLGFRGGFASGPVIPAGIYTPLTTLASKTVTGIAGAVGGAMLGGSLGDSGATMFGELFTGTEKSQSKMDALFEASKVGEALEDANKDIDDAKTSSSGGGTTTQINNATNNQSNTTNIQQSETSWWDWFKGNSYQQSGWQDVHTHRMMK